MRGMLISSFTNGIHELVHIRTLTRSRFVNEDSEGMLQGPEQVDDDDMEGGDSYHLGEKLRWEHAVAYDGEMVTEEIMQMAYRPTGMDWTKPHVGRWLTLPTVVWNILESWRTRGRPEVPASLDNMMESLALPPGSEASQTSRPVNMPPT